MEQKEINTTTAEITASVPTSTSELPASKGDVELRKRKKKEEEKMAFLSSLESLTGIPKSYFALGVVFAFILLVFFGVGMSLLCRVVGFFYPLYESFKCIEDPKMPQLRLWLSYWLVYGLFTLAEAFSDTAFSWLPFYYAMKLAFLVCCFHPVTQWAIIIFDKGVRPILERNVKQFEFSLSEMQDTFLQLAEKTTDQVKSKGMEVGQKIQSAVSERKRRHLETETSTPVTPPPVIPTPSVTSPPANSPTT